MQLCMEDKLPFLNYLNERFLFYSITVIAFLGVGILLLIQSTYSYFEKNKIPRGNLPAFPFGNIKDVLFKKTTLHDFLWKYYNRFKRKGYKFAGLYLFTRPSILIVNQSIIYKVLSDENNFIDLYERINQFNPKKIVDRLQSTEDNFLNNFNNNRDRLLDIVEIDRGLENTMRNFFLETFSMHFGFNTYEILEEINLLLKGKTQSTFYHYLKLVFPILRTKNKKLQSHLTDIVEEIMEIRKKNDIRKYDIIQIFIDLYNLDDSLDISEITSEIFDNFINNLIWSYSVTLLCLHELAANDDIQEELIGEIRRFNNKNKSLNKENLQDLVYLDAVIKETLRKHPQVSFVLKKCNKGYKHADLKLDLPRDIFVFISILGIHKDPNNYTNPDSFDPDRFFEERRKSIKHNTFLPFGFGTKSQIGLYLSTLHTKLCLLGVLSKISVHFPKDTSHTVQLDPEKLTMQLKEPVTFHHRIL